MRAVEMGVNIFLSLSSLDCRGKIALSIAVMDDTDPFKAIDIRAFNARMPVSELLEKAGVGYITYWRARSGRHRKADTIAKVLRALETQLDVIEADRAK